MASFRQAFSRLIMPEYMVKDSVKLGDSYPAKEMYASFVKIA